MRNGKTRHVITFEDPDDLEAVILAQAGRGNKVILARTHGKLTSHQINYRLHKSKVAEGLPNGQGYRTQWRDGTSQLAQDFDNSILPSVRKRVGKTLPPHFVKG